MGRGVHVQDEYDKGYVYDEAPQRQSTIRTQASLASQQSRMHEGDLGAGRLRMGVSALGPKTQSLAPFQVSSFCVSPYLSVVPRHAYP